ncbi:MAG: hypothetical protein PHP41_03250 [Bacilli bacterium]|nr:hypothetical protein [Bacilli bacterium]
MKKAPIGILDMATDNITIMNTLAVEFPYESFIYLNDLAVMDYEGMEEEAILKRVKEQIAFLLSQQVKLIVVVSNTIIEYCKDYFNEIPVPVINMVDSIINYVNDNYELKNMVFLASEAIIKANIYQKNFRYNHLYTVPIDTWNQIVTNNHTKTTQSFHTVKEGLKQAVLKEVDIIIPTDINLLQLATEMMEYMKDAYLLPMDKILCENIKAALLTIENIYLRGKRTITVGSTVSKKEFVYSFLLHMKYHFLFRK